MKNISKNTEKIKKVIVFGTFDIFHEGHKYFLKNARKYGDYLVAVIARDKTVRGIKGKLPRNNELIRLKNVYESGLVDEVVLGSLGDKYKIISKYKPDIICLGYDQNPFADKLSEKLKEIESCASIKRLGSYRPEIFKSSKL